MWRIFQLNKHLSKEGHVWSKFGSGNRESLSKAAKELKAKGKLRSAIEDSTSSHSNSIAPSPIPSRISSPAPSIASTHSETEADGGAIGRETRRRLVEWWSKEYCASRMRLCVVGKGNPATSLYHDIYSLANRVSGRTRKINFHVVLAYSEPWPGRPSNDP